MVAHLMPLHVGKRQGDPFTIPTVSGVGGVTTVESLTSTVPTLALDASASTGVSMTAPPLGISITPTITSRAPVTSTDDLTASTTRSTSSASGQIPISTVVGSCIGALIGAVALVLLGLWFYRRYVGSLKKYSKARGRLSLARSRNNAADQERSRSRQEPWNKLEEGDDKWEGMYQAKEMDNVAPMEKLTMFKKSPSVRTAYTHKSEEPTTFEHHPFAQYHPNLAEELASGKTPGMPVPRPFLGRVDAGPAISWDGETIANGSYLSVHSNRLSGGAMSPTLNMAIPTPVVTSSHPHRWESAEVVHIDHGQSAEVFDNNNPFGAGSERRKSTSNNNPFFKGQEYPERRRSRSYSQSSNHSHSRSRSNSTIQRIPKASKGKEREISPTTTDDPFDDGNTPPFTIPFSATHTAQGSFSSVSSNERAMKSLIAALEVSEEEVHARLRVASMQPSFISTNSNYTTEEDVAGSFPLPPSTDGGHQDRQNRPVVA
ncbi:hypothetical protein BDZ94DRAFT_846904 [Collybia nuda]|uniref:Uncharacterized protein n=1 Tax=Collybia nuda TaxID=64659 RepID=A0A9P6CIY8_9AGAR|nr:hypothetical protein BDZ94DRAFT_846904 [Collybia nuda]